MAEELKVVVTADTRDYMRGMKKIHHATRQNRDEFGRFTKKATFGWAAIGTAAVAAGAAIAATAVILGKKAVKSAVDFQSAVLKTRTMLDITEDQVSDLNERLEEQSKVWGIPAIEQAAAAYKIASGMTKDVDEAMKFLTATNKLAVVGFDALEGSTATTIKVMRAAGFDISRTDEITKKLWATVRAGILETADLEGAMGKLGTAFEFVPFEQVSAAYSVLTTKLGSTEEAATALNKLVLALTSTTSKGARAAREQGIEFGIVALQEKGLIGILKELDVLHDKDIAAWKETFPELRAFRGAAGLTGESLVEMGDNLSTFSEKMLLFDKLLLEVMGSARKEADRTREEWDDAWRDIGEEILPGMTKVLKEDLLPLLQDFSGWIKDNREDITSFFTDLSEVLKEAVNLAAELKPAFEVAAKVAPTVIPVARAVITGIRRPPVGVLGPGLGPLEASIRGAIFLGANYFDAKSSRDRMEDGAFAQKVAS